MLLRNNDHKQTRPSWLDVNKRLHRSRGTAGRAGVAGDALRTFYYYISALLLLPRFLRGKDGPGPVLYKYAAAE